VLIFGWLIFAYVAYETSQVQIDFTEFDPYTELGIDRVPSYVFADSLIGCESNGNKNGFIVILLDKRE